MLWRFGAPEPIFHGMETGNGWESLNRHDCFAHLEDRRVGRVAVCDAGLPLVRPMNFGVVGGEIVMFAAHDSRLAALADGRDMVFEVDDADDNEETGWSVIVVGPATVGEHSLRQRAEAVGVYPWAAGEHNCVLRIRPREISGRQISPGRRPARS